MNVLFWISFGALWALVAFQTFVLLGLTRVLHSGGVQPAERGDASLDGYEETLRGEPAPAFSAVDLTGAQITNETLHGRPAALLFISPDCESCAVTLAELEALKSKASGTVVVCCRSSHDRCAQIPEVYGLDVSVVVDERAELSRLFRVAGSPTAVLIGQDGLIETYGRPMQADDLAETLAEHGWQVTGDGEAAGQVALPITQSPQT